MTWDVELGKQITMIMLFLIIILVFVLYKKIEKVNLFFFIGYIVLSINDFYFYFFAKFSKVLTEKFYSICIVIVFFLYLIYYLNLLYIPMLRKMQFVILFLFAVNIFGMSFIEQSFFEYLSFTIFYINILLLIFSIILFLYQTFNSDKIFEIKNYLPFWISVGSLILYIGIIPIFFFRTTVTKDIYFFILFILNLINNGIIVFGLLWNKPDKVKQAES